MRGAREGGRRGRWKTYHRSVQCVFVMRHYCVSNMMRLVLKFRLSAGPVSCQKQHPGLYPCLEGVVEYTQPPSGINKVSLQVSIRPARTSICIKQREAAKFYFLDQI